MGFSSQAGQLIAKTQTTPGTYDPTTGTAGVGIKLKSGSFAPNRELMILDAEIGGGRDVVDAMLGGVSYSGDFDFYARPQAVALLLKACLGTVVSTVASGVNTHTITPSDAAQLPFLSVEHVIGNGLEAYQYTDVVVTSLHLEAEANGFLQGTVSMIARIQTAGITKTAAPVWDNTEVAVGTNILCYYNGVTLPAKSFSLDIANNFDDDDFRLGSFFIGDLTPKRREVTGGFSIRPNDSSLWRQAVNGQASAVSPGGLVTKAPFRIDAKTYATIAGSTPLTPFEYDISMPNFALRPYALEASGDDVIENDIEGQALRPSNATPVMTVLVKNDKAAVA